MEGAVSCIVECLAASLALPTRCQQHPHSCENQKFLDIFQVSPGEQNCSWLKITDPTILLLLCLSKQDIYWVFTKYQAFSKEILIISSCNPHNTPMGTIVFIFLLQVRILEAQRNCISWPWSQSSQEAVRGFEPDESGTHSISHYVMLPFGLWCLKNTELAKESHVQMQVDV